MLGRVIDDTGNERCDREVDPNGVFQVAVGRLVTPMSDSSGKALPTPLEVLLDVVGDVNRADPSATGALGTDDYVNIMKIAHDFLADKNQGLEQFYAVFRSVGGASH